MSQNTKSSILVAHRARHLRTEDHKPEQARQFSTVAPKRCKQLHRSFGGNSSIKHGLAHKILSSARVLSGDRLHGSQPEWTAP
jgi:hypothetical protein